MGLSQKELSSIARKLKIKDTDRLYKAIHEHVRLIERDRIFKDNHQRLIKALDTLDWNPTRVAQRLNIPDRTMRHMVAGKARIPEETLNWLEVLANFHEEHPPPLRCIT